MYTKDVESRFVMSEKELDRLQILQRVENKELKQKDAAKILNLSLRQFEKVLKSYRKHGVNGIISQKRARCGRKPYSIELKNHVIDLAKSKYIDFYPTFLAEKLEELHGIKISRETLRKWLIEAELYKPNIKKKQVHRARDRRDNFGELVQIDGSPHDWFEGRGPKCTLLVFIDDATSKLLSLVFA